METPVTTPVNPASTKRSLTTGEAQKLVSDAWTALNMRLAPGRLDTSCFFRVDDFCQKHYPDVKTTVLNTVFTNYKEAVRVLADGYFRSATAEELFYGDALEWVVPHPAIAKRKQRELEQRGLSRTPDANEFDVVGRNQAAADTEKANMEHVKAVHKIETVIANVYFQGQRGTLDQRMIDTARADLRSYVSKNLTKINGVKILSDVVAQVEQKHKWHERNIERLNSR